MKQKLHILIFLFFATPVLMAQSDDKIKGDRNVTIKQTYIDDFDSIVVDGDFEVEIVFNSKPSVQIEADDNLHAVIDFQVVDGVLSFTETVRITSKKQLQITVNYSSSLNNIEVRGDGELRSLTSMELGDVKLVTADNSRAYLNINAKNFNYKSSGKSKTRLNLTADSTKLELSDNSKIDALINSKIADFDLYQRADAVIEGTGNTSLIRLSNSANFDGGKFTVKTAEVSLEDNSDLTLDVTSDITINSSGDCETYLYGTPKITLSKFEGTSKLQKKER
ncbi:GIN domain-containing protein [Winogradskyella ursingii]|uniref:GIN domain-containing protein n=1 Tax=Winogradskyella ursingii TaxID=2686079 RepID=UPI001FECB007|nr:DUF2807 domain-containing protein [Winogradskyella ursingii]